MAYQVLARKWRPSNFSQLIGQEHVSQSLIHALQNDRLHHAYLFTGTRGVGKTTVARILAKAINCENLQDFNPCGSCRVCVDFDQGRFMDLIEVDAASRTKVEDTRDLLDNVQYAPNQGRYKVYLIDEVHMLSGHSFNALLKTLEEPPAHVKFLLATTDPHKIPVTVLSRCLQFNLKALTPEQIKQQLSFILSQEGINFEANALSLLARAADGSLRDALSLLDQAIVYGSGQVNMATINGMLGSVAQQPITDLLNALATGCAEKLLTQISELAELSPDYDEVLQQLLQALHRTAIKQQLPNFNDNQFDSDLINQLAQQLNQEQVQLYYQIGLIGRRDLNLAPDPRSGFEMIMLRMLTFQPLTQHSQAIIPNQTIPKKTESITSTPVNTSKPVVTVAEQATTPKQDWSEIIAAMNINGRTKELANNCVLADLDDNRCELLLDPSFQRVGNKAEQNLQTALQNYFGKPLKLEIKSQSTQQLTPAIEQQQARENLQQAAIDSINNDPNVTNLKENFAARILPGSIEPIN